MNRFLLLAFVLTNAGCALPATSTSAEVPEQGITASAAVEVRDPADRVLLVAPALTPWVKANIDHVKLDIYRGTDTTPKATLTVVKADLAKTVTFTNLIRSSSYRITTRAWSDAAEQSRIDNLEADAASCTKTFTTDTSTLNYTLGTVPLKLRSKTFAGTTDAASILVDDGVIADTTATETIRLNGAN